MKRCSRCHLDKPLDEFHRQSKSSDGAQSECKSCKHERKAIKAGDSTKVIRIREGKVQEYLRGPNHGESKTRLYRKWKSMHSRCANPNSNVWKWYGGKGIRVTEQWANWHTFRQWAYDSGYQDGLELDRVDAEGDYSPTNCRWITKRENVKRARSALDAAVNVQLMAEAAARGITPETLIAEIVTIHYTAADELLATSDSQSVTGSVTDGKEVMADVNGND